MSGLIEALLKFLRSLFGGGGTETEDPESAQASSLPKEYPYRKRESLLSANERRFYHRLRVIAAVQGWVVFSKIRLEDLIEVRSGAAAFSSHRGRIRARHIDFVLCHPDTVAPLVAVELNDSSHTRPDRHERDEFVERALQAAGLPLLWVKGDAANDGEHLLRLLCEKAGVQPNLSATSAEPQPETVLEAVTNSSNGRACPKCGALLVERHSRRDGTSFLGCSGYPHCRHTEPVSETASSS